MRRMQWSARAELISASQTYKMCNVQTRPIYSLCQCMCINLNENPPCEYVPTFGLLRLGSAPAASWLYKAQLIEAAAAMAILPIHLVIFLAEKPGLRHTRDLKRQRLLLMFLFFVLLFVLPRSYQASTQLMTQSCQPMAFL